MNKIFNYKNLELEDVNILTISNIVANSDISKIILHKILKTVDFNLNPYEKIIKIMQKIKSITKKMKLVTFMHIGNGNDNDKILKNSKNSNLYKTLIKELEFILKFNGEIKIKNLSPQLDCLEKIYYSLTKRHFQTSDVLNIDEEHYDYEHYIQITKLLFKHLILYQKYFSEHILNLLEENIKYYLIKYKNNNPKNKTFIFQPEDLNLTYKIINSKYKNKFIIGNLSYSCYYEIQESKEIINSKYTSIETLLKLISEENGIIINNKYFDENNLTSYYDFIDDYKIYYKLINDKRIIQ